MSKGEPNLILVVDDDPGMLKSIKRLLRQLDYEPILFSSAQAFKSHTDFESCLRHLRHQPDRRVRDRTETWSQSRRRFRAGYLHHRQREPCRSGGCAELWVRRVSNKPFSAQELIEPLHRVAGFA